MTHLGALRRIIIESRWASEKSASPWPRTPPWMLKFCKTETEKLTSGEFGYSRIQMQIRRTVLGSALNRRLKFSVSASQHLAIAPSSCIFQSLTLGKPTRDGINNARLVPPKTMGVIGRRGRHNCTPSPSSPPPTAALVTPTRRGNRLAFELTFWFPLRGCSITLHQISLRCFCFGIKSNLISQS